jgi:hypothetical protein
MAHASSRHWIMPRTSDGAYDRVGATLSCPDTATHVERRETAPLAIERVVVVVCIVSVVDYVVADGFSSSLSLFTVAAAPASVPPELGVVCCLRAAFQAKLARAEYSRSQTRSSEPKSSTRHTRLSRCCTTGSRARLPLPLAAAPELLQ